MYGDLGLCGIDQSEDSGPSSDLARNDLDDIWFSIAWRTCWQPTGRSIGSTSCCRSSEISLRWGSSGPASGASRAAITWCSTGQVRMELRWCASSPAGATSKRSNIPGHHAHPRSRYGRSAFRPVIARTGPIGYRCRTLARFRPRRS